LGVLKIAILGGPENRAFCQDSNFPYSGKSSYTENPHFRHTLKNGYIIIIIICKKNPYFYKVVFFVYMCFLVIVKKEVKTVKVVFLYI
jgi:hypothetical protein